VIPAKRAHLFVAATTHPGMKGKNNEDRYAVSAYHIDEDQRTASVFAIVSDGIGGHRAGEVAAEIAVETINQKIAESDASQPTLILEDAVIQASEAIRKQAEADPAQKGMGATCVCAWVIGDRLYSACVGDSRLYLIREHTIRKLSIDHTWVQEAIDQGTITPDQARSHPNAHVIRRYLGSPQGVVPDLRLRLRPEDSNSQAESNQGLPLLPGDVLILCSDGLTDLVDDPEILELVETQSLDSALTQLEDLANQRGGHDNITIIGMQVPIVGALTFVAHSKEITKPLALETASSEVTQQIRRSDLKAEQKLTLQRRRLVIFGCLGIASLLVIAAGVLGAASWIANHSIQATISPTVQTPVPSSTLLVSAQPSITITYLSLTVTATAQTPFPSQATLTPWPTNTLMPSTQTPPNPFITSIP
jgi:serine/threonine protein phosphatase PrpC